MAILYPNNNGRKGWRIWLLESLPIIKMINDDVCEFYVTPEYNKDVNTIFEINIL